MNAWFDLAAPAWRLAGWTMLHFLWAGTLVALVGGAVRAACRRAAPGVRYGASLVTLVMLAALPVGIAACLSLQPGFAASKLKPPALPVDSAANDPAVEGVHRQSRWLSDFESRSDSTTVIDLAKTDATVDASPVVIEPRAEATIGNPSPSPSLRGRGSDAPLDRVVAWLPVAWLVGAPLTFALLAAGLVGSRRLSSGATAIVEGPVFDACRRLEKSLGIARQVALAACDRLAQPVLVGILRPTILLPASVLTGWSAEELEMVLLHELAHVRRWDNLVNLAQRVVESLLFFHPCVWLASRQVRRDREECCDAIVVRHTARPEEYAELLIRAASCVPRRALTTLAASCTLTDHPLAGRVRRILKLEEETMHVSRRTLGALLIALAAIIAATYRVAVAEPRDGETERAKPQAAEADGQAEEGSENGGAIYTITFSADNYEIRGSEWLKLISNLPTGAKISFNERSQRFTLTGPEELRDRVTAFFDAAQAASRPATADVQKLRADIAMFHALLDQSDKELADIEVLKEVAIEAAQSPTALDAAVQAELDKDPLISKFKLKLSELSQLRQNQNAQQPEAEADYAQMETLLKEYRTKAEKDARDRLAKIPNEALRAAIVEYKVRQKYLNEKKAELEEKLSAAEARLAALTAGSPMVAAGGADAEAAAFQDPLALRIAVDGRIEIDGATVELSELLERLAKEPKSRQVSLTANAACPYRHVVAVIDACHQAGIRQVNVESAQKTTNDPAAKGEYGQPVEYSLDKAIALLERVEGGDLQASDSLAESEREAVLRSLFHVSHANLLEVVTYTIDPNLGGYPDTLFDALEGLRTDPYGPRLQFDVEKLDGGKQIRVAAPAAAQRWIKLLIAEFERKDEARKSAPASSGSVQYMHTVTLPAEMREEDARRIAKELEEAGHTARVLTDEGALQLEIRTNVDHPQLVWEQRLVDGKPQVTARVVSKAMQSMPVLDEEAKATTDGGGRNPSPSPSLPGRGIQGPYRFQAGDVVKVRVAPRVDDNSLDGSLMVEEEGTLPLGPVFGRVKVAELTVEEAEAAIGKHLAEIIKEPHVQITIVQKARSDDSAGAQRTPEVIAAYQRGVKAAKDGDSVEALAQFAKAIKGDGSFFEAYLAKGDALKGMKEYPEAIAAYTQALEINIWLPAAYNGRGECYMEMSPPDYKSALNDFSNALDQDPRNATARANRDRARKLGGGGGANLPTNSAGTTVLPGGALPENRGAKTATVDGVPTLVAPFLENTTEEQARRIVQWLRDQRFDANVKSIDGKLQLQLHRLPEGTQIVWEERMVDGQRLPIPRPIAADGSVLPMPEDSVPAILPPSAEGGAPAKAVFLYDGKTFDEWRELSKIELKVERRKEAIEALAAFARAGFGRDAAEAIFDVAGEYDFYTIDDSAEGKLKERVFELLTTANGAHVSEVDWLPALKARVDADPRKWEWFAVGVLNRLETSDKGARAILEELTGAPTEIGAAANKALAWLPNLVREMMKHDTGYGLVGFLEERELGSEEWNAIKLADTDGDSMLTENEILAAPSEALRRASEWEKIHASGQKVRVNPVGR